MLPPAKGQGGSKESNNGERPDGSKELNNSERPDASNIFRQNQTIPIAANTTARNELTKGNNAPRKNS